MPSLSGVPELNAVTSEGFNWFLLDCLDLVDTPFIELCRLDDAERRGGVPTQERGNERKREEGGI